MISVEKQILNRIYGNGRVWAFSKIDFVDLGSAQAIEKALSRQAKKGTIRRVMRGIYDYPKFSKLLDQELSPDMSQVAQAVARKNGWKVQVSGNAALNILGLSTQVPNRYVFLSDGGNKNYKVEGRELAFKKSRLKDIGVKYPESALLVQALRELGPEGITSAARTKLADYFEPKTSKRILKDAQYTTAWIYEEIKKIFKDG